MNKSFFHSLILIIFMVAANASNGQVNSTTSDSVYTYYQNNDIENYQNALPVLKSAYNYVKTTQDSCKISGLSRRITNCYEALGYSDSAIQQILWAEPFAKGCGLEEYAKNRIVLTGVYLLIEDYERIIKIVNEVEASWPTGPLDTLIDELPNNKAIALVYLGRMDEAKEIFKGIYLKHKLRDDVDGQLYALNNLGAFFGMLEELDSAAYYLRIASELCAKTDCDDRLELLQNLATLAGMQDQHEVARVYLDSAISIARKSENLKAETELLREISIVTINSGDAELAWEFLIDHANLQDSLYNSEMAEAIANFQEQYESEKKARKIRELEIEQLDSDLRESQLEQTRNIILIVGIAIFLLAFGLWRRLKYISKTKAVIEEERNRADELLLNILPFEVAQELKEKGQSEAKDYDNVTVLFTDFQGFTETAESLSAKDLVDEINICFRAFDEVIQKYQIEKIKTIGDAYMAAGGLHVPRTSEPIDVVKAALEMQLFMVNRKRDRVKQNLTFFDMRVGIHTGPVVAGIVGVKKFQYDIWGDTVNTASRMESHGEIGKVNISQTTYELLKDNSTFAFESRGEMEVKGKGRLLMHFVSNAEST